MLITTFYIPYIHLFLFLHRGYLLSFTLVLSQRRRRLIQIVQKHQFQWQLFQTRNDRAADIGIIYEHAYHTEAITSEGNWMLVGKNVSPRGQVKIAFFPAVKALFENISYNSIFFMFPTI